VLQAGSHKYTGMGNYQPMGNVYDGRLGSAVINPFDGVDFGATDFGAIDFGATEGPKSSPAVAAAEKEVADAAAELGRISGQIGSNPAKAAELPAVQERLAAAAKKLGDLKTAEFKASQKEGGSIIPLLLVVAAGVGGFLWWRGRQ